MFPNEKVTSTEVDSKAVPAAPSPLHNILLLVREDTIRGVKALDHLLDVLYLPAEVQEQKKKCTPDEADAFRLHGLGVSW